MKKALPWLLVAVMTALLFFSVRECSHKAAQLAKVPTATITEIPPLPADTFTDSFPVPVYIDTGSYTLEVIKEEIDSTQFWEMVFQYLLTYGYDSVYKNDSVAYIRLQHEVTRNKLRCVRLIYENRIKQQIVKYDTCGKSEKWAVYGGPWLGGGKSVNAGAYIVFTQDKMNIWLSADLINKGLQGGVGIKLFSKKK